MKINKDEFINALHIFKQHKVVCYINDDDIGIITDITNNYEIKIELLEYNQFFYSYIKLINNINDMKDSLIEDLDINKSDSEEIIKNIKQDLINIKNNIRSKIKNKYLFYNKLKDFIYTIDELYNLYINDDFSESNKDVYYNNINFKLAF